MNLLVLKKFNNYFNRKIIKYSSTADYIAAAAAYSIVSNFNFNPNDAVRTTVVLGKGDLAGFFDFEKTNTADYLVCYTTTTENNVTTEAIDSRWFITEVVRTRAGQYEISLKRDSIADNLSSLYQAPAFIKKGTVSDENPLIVNSEGVSVNQIKNDEILLKDNTGSAWIVGYMAKNAPSTAISTQIPTADVTAETIESIAAELGISAQVLDGVLTEATDNQSYFVNDNIEMVGWVNYVDSSDTEYRIIAGSSDGLNSIGYGKFAIKRHSTTSDCFCKTVDNPTFPDASETSIGSTTYDSASELKLADIWKNAVNTYRAQIKSNWQSYTTHPLLTRAVYNKLNNLKDNNILIYKLGKYYKINVNTVTGPTNTGQTYSAAQAATPMSSICSKVISDWNAWADAQGQWYANYGWHCYPHLELRTGGKIFLNYNEIVASFYLEEVTDLSNVPGINVAMSTTRKVLYDQPYDMFAIPFNNTTIVNGNDSYEVIGDYAQKIAMALVKELTSANVYDVQLLPYCPIPNIAGSGYLNITGLTSGTDYDFITQTGTTAQAYADVDGVGNEYAPGQYEAEFYIDTGVAQADYINCDYEIIDDGGTGITSLVKSTSVVGGTVRINYSCQINSFDVASHMTVRIWWTYTSHDPIVKSIVIYPSSNSFSVNINQNLVLKDSMKIESQCNNYRLVSPNYQGSFDFNVAKNGGTVNGFIAECTYKPYTPYIKVTPNFAWLYGTNFGDARGLICGGDFSIGIMNSAWEQYQLQNKNYQNIFNREIQSLDIAQSIQRQQQYTTGFIKQFSDSAAGGVAGGIATGSPWGIAIGATVAGGMSTTGYVIDNQMMERQLIDQRQLQLDKFHMQLGNIQALPYTLTKVGAFTINSKIWPFLEYYTCTAEEKTALQNKIYYEGMTIGIVDTLGNYLQGGYVQADLIRNDDITDDAHLLEDIYIELSKGVYM